MRKTVVTLSILSETCFRLCGFHLASLSICASSDAACLLHMGSKPAGGSFGIIQTPDDSSSPLRVAILSSCLPVTQTRNPVGHANWRR